MNKRTISGLAIGTITAVIARFSYIPPVMMTATAIVCGFCIYELASATGVEYGSWVFLLALASAGALSFLPGTRLFYAYICWYRAFYFYSVLPRFDEIQQAHSLAEQWGVFLFDACDCCAAFRASPAAGTLQWSALCNHCSSRMLCDRCCGIHRGQPLGKTQAASLCQPQQNGSWLRSRVRGSDYLLPALRNWTAQFFSCTGFFRKTAVLCGRC